jgi:integrase/recombinase XerD
MNQCILEFEAWLREEDKAEQTIRSYIGTIKSFAKWNEQSDGKGYQPKDTSVIQIMDYRSYLLNTLEQKPTSVNRAIAGLKTFFSWATEVGYTANNPSIKVKMKRVQQTHSPKWLKEKEQNRLLNALELEKNEAKQARDKAIVFTMLLAGLRVEEVCDLKIGHIDLRQELITVLNGKGGKYRTVPLHNDLKKILKIWLTYRQDSDKVTHQQSDYLFVSERSGLMTTRAIAFMVDRYLELAGLLERSKEGTKIQGQASCHSLRHSFCKSLVDVGVPIQNIAKLAGHDSIQTTQRYVEASENDLRKAIQSLK